MEKKQKDLISIFLLVVGVIFILVAGGIFVTTAWQYLPVFVKQLALLVVAGGMFGGSYKLSKNEKLGWISETLFHLGNTFVGFFVVAVMGGVVENGIVGNAFKVMTASGTMAMLVGMKLVVQKHAFDFAAVSLLVDSLLLSGCTAFGASVDVYMYLLAGFTVVLAVMDSMQQNAGAKDGLSMCIGITYLIHACVYAVLTTVYSTVAFDASREATVIIEGVLLSGVIVAFTTLSWIVRKNVAIRVFNSLTAIWFAVVAVNGAFSLAHYQGEYGVVMVLVTVVVAMLTVWLRRNEMTGILVTAAVVIPFGQLFCYFFDALIGLFDGMDSDWTTTYHPYSFILGAALFALYIVKYGCDDIFAKWRESRLLKLAGLQMVTGSVMWLASKMADSWFMVLFLLIAMDVFFVASLFKNETVKRVFMTIAMLNFVTAVFGQPFVEISNNYSVEWTCFLITIGIVLFRHIWYDYKKQLSMLYFVVTCVMLGVLLLSNLNSGGIGNVMILGMIGIVMLITAAIHNNKKYVIASSTTLIILVLYLTREFWLSIAWWVYLFAAGVVLVLLAVKKAKEA